MPALPEPAGGRRSQGFEAPRHAMMLNEETNPAGGRDVARPAGEAGLRFTFDAGMAGFQGNRNFTHGFYNRQADRCNKNFRWMLEFTLQRARRNVPGFKSSQDSNRPRSISATTSTPATPDRQIIVLISKYPQIPASSGIAPTAVQATKCRPSGDRSNLR